MQKSVVKLTVENVIELTLENLFDEIKKAKDEKYRFVTISCADLGDGRFDLIYHFDKDYVLKNFRLTVNKNDEVPSVSKIFFCALLVENEIKELFGVKIKDIILDYEGRLLLSENVASNPMAKGQIIVEKRGEK